MTGSIAEDRRYTIGEFALYSGLSIDEIWARLERGELSAGVYAESDLDGMPMPGWRALPQEVVPTMRAGTNGVVEWTIRGGRVLARCDPDAVRVMPLDPDVAALLRPRTRATGLRAAVEGAWRSGRLSINATVSQVMGFIDQHDQSDCVVRIEATAIIWLDDKGKERKTKKASFANSLVTWRKKFCLTSATPLNTK